MHINLMRINLKMKNELVATGEASVQFSESRFDSWSELPVVKMLGACKMVGELEFSDFNAVQEVPMMQIMPHTISKFDAEFAYFSAKYAESK